MFVGSDYAGRLSILRDVAVPKLKLSSACGVYTRLLVSPLLLGASSRVETDLVEYSVSVPSVHAGMVPVQYGDSDMHTECTVMPAYTSCSTGPVCRSMI